MAMSRIRHLVWPTQSDVRNSSADENARTQKPSSRRKSGSDSRTDSSSSTTDTSEDVTVINFFVPVSVEEIDVPVSERRSFRLSGAFLRLRHSPDLDAAVRWRASIVLRYCLGRLHTECRTRT